MPILVIGTDTATIKEACGAQTTLCDSASIKSISLETLRAHMATPNAGVLLILTDGMDLLDQNKIGDLAISVIQKTTPIAPNTALVLQTRPSGPFTNSYISNRAICFSL